MTLEFSDDQVIAHLDHHHIAFAKHPIIRQERTYFAFQVDQAGASFDNVQVFQVGRHPKKDENLYHVLSCIGKFPLQKTPKEEYRILKQNLHAKLHMTDPAYRALVEQVDLLDNEKIKRFPEVFSSSRELSQKRQDLREKLLREDPLFQKLMKDRRAAHAASLDYLHKKDKRITKLKKILNSP